MMWWMLMYGIIVIAVVALASVVAGAWLRAWWSARQELQQRGWVCIDLPSPDTVPASLPRPAHPRPAGLLAPALCVLTALAVTSWLLANCALLVR